MAKQKINKSKNTALESHKKSDKAKWAITFISLILIATLLGGLSFYIVNNNKTNNPPAISNNNNIFFDFLEYQLTDSQIESEIAKFYNVEVSEHQKESIPFTKRVLLKCNDNKILFTPCFNLIGRYVDFESSSTSVYLVSFNLSKLFEDNILVLEIPNLADNYDNITWIIGKETDTDTIEYGYAFRRLDNDIILSIGFRNDEPSSGNLYQFLLDNSLIEIDINN